MFVLELDVGLAVGILETGQYGHNYGTNNHLEELVATFDSTSENLVLSVDGYDIDYANEVLVSLNGAPLGYLTVGANNGLNGGDSFSVLAVSQVAGENVLSFKQVRTVGFKWGVTNLLLAVPPASPVIDTTSLPDGEKNVAYSQTLAVTGGVQPHSWSLTSGALPAGLSLSTSGVLSGTPSEGGTFNFDVQVSDAMGQVATQPLTLIVTSLDIALTIGVLETGQYGYKYGTASHQFGIPLVFQNAGVDLVLTLDGYDIDFTDEVSVSLNGVFLGYLSKGPNNNLNAGDTFSIPALDQIQGSNIILVDQNRSRNYKWGATNILLDLAP